MMQRIPFLYQHLSPDAKQKKAPSQITSTVPDIMKHKFEMINGFKQFGTCHVQREIWHKELHFYTKNCDQVKFFSKCYNYGTTAFFAQATPGGWGGGGVRNLFLGAQFFSTIPPCPRLLLQATPIRAPQ